MGARSSCSSAGGTTATATSTPSVYRAVLTSSDSAIPNGMLRDGSLISSAALATLVSPP